MTQDARFMAAKLTIPRLCSVTGYSWLVTLFYDKDAQEIDFWHYEQLFSDYKYRVVAAHRTREMVIVRTEWMGYDPEAIRPPRLFRTMVQGGVLSGHEVWVSSEDEALVEHRKLLELVREGHSFTWKALASMFLLTLFVGLLLIGLSSL